MRRIGNATDCNLCQDQFPMAMFLYRYGPIGGRGIDKYCPNSVRKLADILVHEAMHNCVGGHDTTNPTGRKQPPISVQTRLAILAVVQTHMLSSQHLRNVNNKGNRRHIMKHTLLKYVSISIMLLLVVQALYGDSWGTYAKRRLVDKRGPITFALRG